MSVTIAAIAAMDEGRVIGADNAIPWRIAEDMQRFSDLTRGHTVLMGRRTYESLPERYRPLPGRKNVVAARSAAEAVFPNSVEITRDAVQYVRECKQGRRSLPSSCLWVIGGQQIYEATMPFWDEVYLTVVSGRHEGQAFFPQFEGEFDLLDQDQRKGCAFLRFRRSR